MKGRKSKLRLIPDIVVVWQMISWLSFVLLWKPLGVIHKWCPNFVEYFWPPPSPLSKHYLLTFYYKSQNFMEPLPPLKFGYNWWTPPCLVFPHLIFRLWTIKEGVEKYTYTIALAVLISFRAQPLVLWQLWNFIVSQVEFNRFLYSNKPPEKIFGWLVR